MEEDYCDEQSNPCQHGVINDFKLMMMMIMMMACTCTTALCRNCKCAKKDIPCRPFCSVVDQKINNEEMLLMETQMLFNPVICFMIKNVE